MKAHFSGEPDLFSRIERAMTGRNEFLSQVPAERKTWRHRLSDSLTCVVRRLSTRDGDSQNEPYRTVGLSERFRMAYRDAREQAKR